VVGEDTATGGSGDDDTAGRVRRLDAALHDAYGAGWGVARAGIARGQRLRAARHRGPRRGRRRRRADRRRTCLCPPYTVYALRPLDTSVAILSCWRARAVSDDFSMKATFPGMAPADPTARSAGAGCSAVSSGSKPSSEHSRLTDSAAARAVGAGCVAGTSWAAQDISARLSVAELRIRQPSPTVGARRGRCGDRRDTGTGLHGGGDDVEVDITLAPRHLRWRGAVVSALRPALSGGRARHAGATGGVAGGDEGPTTR